MKKKNNYSLLNRTYLTIFKSICLALLLFSHLIQAQVQIGSNMEGYSVFDDFGNSVALSADGSIVAIGAPGTFSGGFVSVFENQNGVWTKLGADIQGEAAHDLFGHSVALSADGSIVAVGARSNDGNGTNSGHVRVYSYQNGTWSQLGADIDGEAAHDLFGYSVALSSDGSVLAVGAIFNDGYGTDSGHVRIYSFENGTWVQRGADIDGEYPGDRAGWSVSLSADGNIVAIGATENDNEGSTNNSGHVRVFSYQNNTWSQLGQDINGEAAGDLSGRSVDLSADGSIVAIGAIYNDGSDYLSGHVRVYSYENGSWNQLGTDLDGKFSNDRLGTAVSLSSDGSILVAGASNNDSGHVRSYSYENGSWNQLVADVYGENNGDYCGHSVSVSSNGSVVAIASVGAYNTNSTASGYVRVFDLSVLSSDEFVLSRFKVFPNPAKDKVTIDLKPELELKEVVIYNNLGQQVIMGRHTMIDTSSLTTGLYYLQIITDKGKGTQKLIIE